MSIYRKLLGQVPKLEPEVPKYNVKKTAVTIELKSSSELPNKVWKYEFTGRTWRGYGQVNIVDSLQCFFNWMKHSAPRNMVRVTDSSKVIYIPLSDVKQIATETTDHWALETKEKEE